MTTEGNIKRGLDNPRILDFPLEHNSCPHGHAQKQELGLGGLELETPHHRIQILPGGEVVSHPWNEVIKELADRDMKRLEFESQELEPPKYRVVVDKKLGEVYQRM